MGKKMEGCAPLDGIVTVRVSTAPFRSPVCEQSQFYKVQFSLKCAECNMGQNQMAAYLDIGAEHGREQERRRDPREGLGRLVLHPATSRDRAFVACRQVYVQQPHDQTERSKEQWIKR